MLKSRLVVISSMLVLAGVLGAASVARGNFEHVNYVAISGRLTLPGISLPAGSYIFERTMPRGSYDLVRVMSRDHHHLYFTAFTRRVQRPLGLPADRQIVFQEVPIGTTPRLQAWYPIGESTGQEFIYSGIRQPANATN